MLQRQDWNNQDNQKEEYFDALPGDKAGQTLLPYFDERWYHIRAIPVPRGKKIKWKTEKKYRISKRNLWCDWKKEEIIIGVGFGDNCRRLVIDLDIGSLYHPYNNEKEYQRLIQTLQNLGLYGQIVIKSSWNGGIHIYFFFDQELNSYEVAKTVRIALTAAGFEIKDGQLEIFPNTKPYAKPGKGFSNFKCHRLPLQPGTGSCILSEFSLEYKGKTLEKFAQMAEMSAKQNDTEHLKRMMRLCQQESPKFWKHLKKRNKISGWYVHIMDAIGEGWTGPHQTNYLLAKIATKYHVFEGLTGEALIDAMVEKAKSLPGYSQYCRHQHEIRQRCKDWGKSVESYYRILYSHPQRKETYEEMFRKTSAETINKNEQKAKETSKKIQKAYDYIIETLGIIPKTVTEWIEQLNKIAKELTGTGIGKNSLFKSHNLTLWHPKHKTAKTPEKASESKTGKDSSNLEKIREESQEQRAGEKIEKTESRTREGIEETGEKALSSEESSIVSEPELREQTSNQTESKAEELKEIIELITAPVTKEQIQSKTENKKEEFKESTEKAWESESEEASGSRSNLITGDNKSSEEKDIIQEKRQPETAQEGESEKILTPCQEIRQKEPKSEKPETLPVEEQRKDSHTLPYMKGNRPPQIVFGVAEKKECEQKTEEAIGVKESLKNATPSLYTKLKQWLRSKQKLRLTREMWGPVDIRVKPRSPKTYMRVETIGTDQELIIDNLDHSSCWFEPDDDSNLMVYVKPVSEKYTWKGGMAVRALNLVPF